MNSKKKVAVIATIVLIIILLSRINATEINVLEFYLNKLFALKNSSDVASWILSDAGLAHNNENEPFIIDLKDNKFRICYIDNENTKKVCTVSLKNTEGVTSAKEFINYYEKINHYQYGFEQELSWRYTKKKADTVIEPYLAVDPRLLSSEENYEIMLKRPHVETNGKLVEEILNQIPFEISSGECFFVIDEYTRLIGWFYFKSNYDGKDFVGCYDIELTSGITYEELTNFQNLTLSKENGKFVVNK